MLQQIDSVLLSDQSAGSTLTHRYDDTDSGTSHRFRCSWVQKQYLKTRQKRQRVHRSQALQTIHFPAVIRRSKKRKKGCKNTNSNGKRSTCGRKECTMSTLRQPGRTVWRGTVCFQWCVSVCTLMLLSEKSFSCNCYLNCFKLSRTGRSDKERSIFRKTFIVFW